jgi:hypothetical protein
MYSYQQDGVCFWIFLKCFGSYFDLSIEMKLLACSDMVLRYQVQFGHW